MTRYHSLILTPYKVRISTRARNILGSALGGPITTFTQLESYEDDHTSFESVDKCGPTTARELRALVATYGKSIGLFQEPITKETERNLPCCCPHCGKDVVLTVTFPTKMK